MITIGIKNAPEEVKFWNPTFFDESYIEIASAGQFLPVSVGWGTSLIGPSSNVDLMIDLILTDQYPYTIYREDHTGHIDWLDNTAYVWDCATKTLEIEGEPGAAKGNKGWWLAAAGLGVLAVVVAKRR